MGKTVNFSVRMENNIKKQCEALFNELGMNLTTAINVFLRHPLRVGGFPFEIRLEHPSKETLSAMSEAERIAHNPEARHYFDIAEGRQELRK